MARGDRVAVTSRARPAVIGGDFVVPGSRPHASGRLRRSSRDRGAGHLHSMQFMTPGRGCCRTCAGGEHCHSGEVSEDPVGDAGAGGEAIGCSGCQPGIDYSNPIIRGSDEEGIFMGDNKRGAPPKSIGLWPLKKGWGGTNLGEWPKDTSGGRPDKRTAEDKWEAGKCSEHKKDAETGVRPPGCTVVSPCDVSVAVELVPKTDGILTVEPLDGAGQPANWPQGKGPQANLNRPWRGKIEVDECGDYAGIRWHYSKYRGAPTTEDLAGHVIVWCSTCDAEELERPEVPKLKRVSSVTISGGPVVFPPSINGGDPPVTGPKPGSGGSPSPGGGRVRIPPGDSPGNRPARHPCMSPGAVWGGPQPPDRGGCTWKRHYHVGAIFGKLFDGLPWVTPGTTRRPTFCWVCE